MFLCFPWSELNYGVAFVYKFLRKLWDFSWDICEKPEKLHSEEDF